MASAADIIATARAQLGKPYSTGPVAPNSFDCSSLMQYAFAQNGINLPRTTFDQYKVGTTVPRGQEKPGDLIFSNWDGDPRGPSHVAMYLGNNQYINAPEPGDVVKIGTLNQGYWQRITNVQRIPGVDGAGGTIGAVNTLPIPGLGDITGAVGGIADAMRTMVGGVNAVGDLAKKLMWLALPSTQVRLASAGLGVGFIAVGIWLLVREARQ